MKQLELALVELQFEVNSKEKTKKKCFLISQQVEEKKRGRQLSRQLSQ